MPLAKPVFPDTLGTVFKYPHRGFHEPCPQSPLLPDLFQCAHVTLITWEWPGDVRS